MKKNLRKKKEKKLKSKMSKKKKLLRKKRKKWKKLLMNMKLKINPNLFGWENLNLSLKKNMLISINHYLMIGKIIYLLNNSQLKVN